MTVRIEPSSMDDHTTLVSHPSSLFAEAAKKAKALGVDRGRHRCFFSSSWDERARGPTAVVIAAAGGAFPLRRRNSAPSSTTSSSTSSRGSIKGVQAGNSVAAVMSARNIPEDPEDSSTEACSEDPREEATAVLATTQTTTTTTTTTTTRRRKSCLKDRTKSSAGQSNDDDCSCNNRPHRAVSWSEVALHTHATVLGDNPAVSRGAPLTIGWETIRTDRLSVEEYEKHRPERRRCKRELLIPALTREDWLLAEGYARSDIKDAAERAQVVQKRRTKNASQGVLEKLLSHRILQTVAKKRSKIPRGAASFKNTRRID